MITTVVYVSPIERKKNEDEKKWPKKNDPRKKTTTERQNKCTIVLIYGYGSGSSLQIFFFSLSLSVSLFLLIDAFTRVNICVNKCSLFFACMCMLLMLMPCLCVHTHVRIPNCHQSISNAHILFDLFFCVQLLRWTTRAYIYIFAFYITLSHRQNVTQNNKSMSRLNKTKRKIRIRWNIIFGDENNGDTRRLMKPIIKGKRNHSRFDNVFLTGAYSNHHL
jgi:hypothetical protein